MKTRHLLVYRYKFWDPVANEVRESQAYSTFDAIMRGLGLPLLDTAMVVPNTEKVQALLALQDSLGR